MLLRILVKARSEMLVIVPNLGNLDLRIVRRTLAGMQRDAICRGQDEVAGRDGHELFNHGRLGTIGAQKEINGAPKEINMRWMVDHESRG